MIKHFQNHLWIIAALGAAAGFSVIYFIDKFLIEKEVKDYQCLPIYTGILGLLGGFLFFIFTGFPILPIKNTLIILLTGILTSLAAPLYFKCISDEEVSKIIPLFQITSIFILIFAWVLLKESITWQAILGFIIIFISVILISTENETSQFKLTKSIVYTIIATIIWASSAILIKYAITSNSFSQILCYDSWGIALGAGLLYIFNKNIRNAFHKSLKTIRKTALVIISVNESIFILCKTLQLFAYSLGKTALVSIITSTQVFFAILYGWILSLIFPQILKEDISIHSILKKIIAACLVFIGIGLLYFE